jgi:hypothetical protein
MTYQPYNMRAENCAVLGYYTASVCNSILTFRDNVSVPTSILRFLNVGYVGCPETSVRNYQLSLRNDPEECSSHLLRDGSVKSRKDVAMTFWRCMKHTVCRFILAWGFGKLSYI